jgi:hypothetical protein
MRAGVPTRMADRQGRSFWTSPWTCGIAGCCLGCVLIPIVFAAVVGGGAFWAWWSSGASDVRDRAVERARSHPAVIDALGEPIETGWLPQGSVHLQNGEGEADFTLGLTGPRGEGRLYVKARRERGEWDFEVLELRVEGRDEVLDLLDGSASQLLEGSPSGSSAQGGPAATSAASA